MARVYVTFSIELKDGADPGRVVEEMDYELKHSEIEDCYILDFAKQLAGAEEN